MLVIAHAIVQAVPEPHAPLALAVNESGTAQPTALASPASRAILDSHAAGETGNVSLVALAKKPTLPTKPEYIRAIDSFIRGAVAPPPPPPPPPRPRKMATMIIEHYRNNVCRGSPDWTIEITEGACTKVFEQPLHGRFLTAHCEFGQAHVEYGTSCPKKEPYDIAKLGGADKDAEEEEIPTTKLRHKQDGNSTACVGKVCNGNHTWLTGSVCNPDGHHNPITQMDGGYWVTCGCSKKSIDAVTGIDPEHTCTSADCPPYILDQLCDNEICRDQLGQDAANRECDGYVTPEGPLGGHWGGGSCFSRDAQACRILDTAASPADAFRACFDESALKVAERVPMAELVGGDYILSAGKGLAHEFARVVVNAHRAESQARSRHPPDSHPQHCLSDPPPLPPAAEALGHCQDLPRQR